MKPEGSQPATIWSGVWRSGFESAVNAIRSEPGPSSGSPRWSRKDAPAERSASAAGRPSGPASPSNTSPREWATMNQGGTPAATSAPIIEPADVPTMYSALPGSQSVSVGEGAERAGEPRAAKHAARAEHQPNPHGQALPLEFRRINARRLGPFTFSG